MGDLRDKVVVTASVISWAGYLEKLINWGRSVLFRVDIQMCTRGWACGDGRGIHG